MASIDLGKGNTTKLLFKLAIPAVIAQLITVVYNIVDKIFIGHIPVIGDNALTGVGVVFPVMLLAGAFAVFVSMGAAAKTSIALGRGDKEQAECILGNSLTLLVIFAVCFTAFFAVFGKSILPMLAATDETIGYAWEYLRIYNIGTIFLLLSTGLNAFIACQGFSTMSMLTILFGAGLNCILDPIFIYWFDMGVAGAATATVVSQAISAFWVISFLMGKRTTIKIRIPNLRLKLSIVLPCLALGVSPFIMQSTEALLGFAFNTQLFKYGGNSAVATMTILSSLKQFSLLPIIGLMQGAQPIISYNFGLGDTKRMKSAFMAAFISCMVYGMLFFIVSIAFPMQLASIFTPKVELQLLSAKAIPVYFAGLIVYGAQTACQYSFIALGNAKSSTFLAILRKIILLIPLIYILPLFIADGVFAVFLAEPVADVLAALTTATMFIISFTKLLKKMDGEQNTLLNK